MTKTINTPYANTNESISAFLGHVEKMPVKARVSEADASPPTIPSSNRAASKFVAFVCSLTQSVKVAIVNGWISIAKITAQNIAAVPKSVREADNPVFAFIMALQIMNDAVITT
jgi:hypothetical protein